MLRKRGGGASTGSVSITGLRRTMEMTCPSSCRARRKYQRRFPRFEPRAIATENSAGRGARGADRGSPFRDVEVIAQLVHVISGARKIGLQMLAGRTNRFDDAISEFAILEARRETRGDVVPESRRHFLVDATIAQDDEALL